MVFNFPYSRIDSVYNIGLSLDASKHSIVENYLKEVYLKFCNDLNLVPAYLQELQFSKLFTEVEFNKHIPDDNEESFINKHFYPKVFPDIKKHENGRLDFHVKFCFTIDRDLTPQKTDSGINYGSVLLGSKPVLYYLWIDSQDIIKRIKANI